MGLIFSFSFFLLGMAVGSFLNMLEYRWAVKNGFLGKKKKGKISLLGGRSFCDGCGKQLAWRENIPVLSWFLLKGKSSCCQSPIPRQYPVVEFLTGVLFLGFFLFQGLGNGLLLVLGSVIVSVLAFIFLVDLKYKIIPDEVTVVLIFLALVYGWASDSLGWENFVAGVVVSLFFLFLFLVTKGKGMGFGDVKFVFFIGLFLGVWGIVIAMYVAFISGALVGLVLVFLKGYGRKSALPFGPFLILGTFLSWWKGYWILGLMERWFFW